MSLRVEEERFGPFEEDWRRFAQSMPAGPEAMVFATPDWMRAWWEAGRGSEDLLLLSMRDEATIVGIAPLMRSGDTIRFLASSDVCDYHDFLFPRDRFEELLRVLLDRLLQLEWRSLVLEGLQDGSATLALLPDLAAKRSLSVAKEPDEVSPRIAVTDSWDAYLETLDKKDRHELRRKIRRLEGAGRVSYGAADYSVDGSGAGAGPSGSSLASANLEKDVAVFLDLLRKSREEKAAFMTPQRERFFHHLARAMARAGHLKLYFLELDGVRVAGAFCFDYRDAYLLYNSGYDTQYAGLGVGLLLKAFLMKDAIDRRKKWYDLLRGAETYKYHLGARDRWLYRLTISRSEGVRP